MLSHHQRFSRDLTLAEDNPRSLPIKRSKRQQSSALQGEEDVQEPGTSNWICTYDINPVLADENKISHIHYCVSKIYPVPSEEDGKFYFKSL